MNPYLKQGDTWHDFHERSLPTVAEVLVLVSRAEQRPRAGFWPIRLRDRLPIIPVPVRLPDPDARLDLQAILHRIYDAAGYHYYIDGGAPEPPLSPEDEAWARSLLPTTT